MLGLSGSKKKIRRHFSLQWILFSFLHVFEPPSNEQIPNEAFQLAEPMLYLSLGCILHEIKPHIQVQATPQLYFYFYSFQKSQKISLILVGDPHKLSKIVRLIIIHNSIIFSLINTSKWDNRNILGKIVVVEISKSAYTKMQHTSLQRMRVSSQPKRQWIVRRVIGRDTIVKLFNQIIFIRRTDRSYQNLAIQAQESHSHSFSQ